MSSTPAAPTGTDISEHEAEVAALAEERQLEFRARHSLTIDAQAHTLLDPAYAREMRAVPIGIEGGRPVIAVADPSEKRLEAIREKVAGDTKFVLVAPESLDALLKSRIFSEGDEGAKARAAAEAAVREQQAAEQAPAAVQAAPAAPAPASASLDVFDAANVTQLAEQLARAAETLISLQTQVQGIAAQFEQTRQELREQKEQLALAAAKADQDRARIKSVAASLAEDVARLDQTKADLTERLSGLVQDE